VVKPGQPYGEQATAYLRSLVEKKSVRVELYGPDATKKRILGTVFLGNANVNVKLVEEGWARKYTGKPCTAYCADLDRAEGQAKARRVGIWGDRNSEDPRTFRARTKRAGEEQRGQITPTTPPKSPSRGAIPGGSPGSVHLTPERTDTDKDESVHVRSYRRKDGTYVREHTRRRPERK
jgi:hypothetical protein